jgi:hypothetical protein
MISGGNALYLREPLGAIIQEPAGFASPAN